MVNQLIYNNLQIFEIDEHKYYLSLKEHYEVGEDESVFDFIKTGYALAYHNNYYSHTKLIEEFFEAVPDRLETLLENPHGIINKVPKCLLHILIEGGKINANNQI